VNGMQRERKALEWECNAMSEGRKSAGGWLSYILSKEL